MALGLGLFGLVSSCGANEEDGDTDSAPQIKAKAALAQKELKDKKDLKGTLRVQNERDLPECVFEINGTFAYVKSLKLFLVCSEGEWFASESHEK